MFGEEGLDFSFSLARSAQADANCRTYATMNTCDGDYLLLPCGGYRWILNGALGRRDGRR
jgi:hypothetical protein